MLHLHFLFLYTFVCYIYTFLIALSIDLTFISYKCRSSIFLVNTFCIKNTSFIKTIMYSSIVCKLHDLCSIRSCLRPTCLWFLASHGKGILYPFPHPPLNHLTPFTTQYSLSSHLVWCHYPLSHYLH